jgi:hypothetical protein
MDCPCLTDPVNNSKCGVWDGNDSACVCADVGLEMETGRPLLP